MKGEWVWLSPIDIQPLKHNSKTIWSYSVSEMAGNQSRHGFIHCWANKTKAFVYVWRLSLQGNTLLLVGRCTLPVEKTRHWQGRLMGWAPLRIATQPFPEGERKKGFNQGQTKHWLCWIWGKKELVGALGEWRKWEALRSGRRLSGL